MNLVLLMSDDESVVYEELRKAGWSDEARAAALAARMGKVEGVNSRQAAIIAKRLVRKGRSPEEATTEAVGFLKERAASKGKSPAQDQTDREMVKERPSRGEKAPTEKHSKEFEDEVLNIPPKDFEEESVSLDFLAEEYAKKEGLDKTKLLSAFKKRNKGWKEGD